VPAASIKADPESLLSEYLPVAKKVAQEAKARFPNSDFDENFSIAQNALWEACQKWNGSGAFEAFFRCFFKRRMSDALRKELGRTPRQQERRGCKVEKIHLDKEVDGRRVSELVSAEQKPLGQRLRDLTEEIRRCHFSSNEEIVVEIVLLQERPARDAAVALGVTTSRISQIRISALRKIRTQLLHQTDFRRPS